MKNAAALIQSSSLGKYLSEEEAAVLDGLMQERAFKDGEFLITEGTTDESLYLLLDGKFEVVKKTAGDDVVSIAVLREGDMAGELSFVDNQLHTVGLRALCDSVVLSLSRTDLEDAIDEHPKLVYNIMRAVVRSTHRIVHRMNHEFIELNNYIFKQHGRY